MDPMSGAFQLTDRVIKLCKLYIQATKDALSDLRTILIEVTSLKMLLENLQFLAECDSEHGDQKILEILLQDEGPIKACADCISGLEKLFPPVVEDIPKSKQKIRELLTVLAWPSKQDKAKRILQEISRFKQTISLALTVDHHHDIKKIIHETKAMHAILDVRKNLVGHFLLGLISITIHNRACSRYESGTGDWILRSSEWEAFLNAKHRCLWIHGIPGAGKTILVSHLIEVIKRCKALQSQNHGLAYYYCYFGHNQEEVAPMLKWFLGQLCRQVECIPTPLFQLYKNGREPNLMELLACLEAVLQGFDMVYLIVDAIDESKPRGDTESSA
ncbi:hypothetical protein N431DRAFT_467148 [Stipitochalara longipes BDJ]|nr:hypothetical protein N431DRAFT_467148 [Stipitochalara longipes BDJ]